MLRLRNYRYSTQHDIAHKTSSYSNLKPKRLSASQMLGDLSVNLLMYYTNNHHSLRKPTRLSVYPMSYVCIVSTIDARSSKPKRLSVYTLINISCINSVASIFK